MLGAMAQRRTRSGFEYESADLDRVERRFWRECWESVPAAEADRHGVELREFGPVQASSAAGLPGVGMMNLVLGATAAGALDEGHLAAACEWMRARGVDFYVPVPPDLPQTGPVESWLAANGLRPGYAWMKFVRDPHPPRFRRPAVEVVELNAGDQRPFGMIAATGFGLPAWAAAFFAELPGREGWHCYVALVDGSPQACAAMLVEGEVAEFGIAATLEPARGRGCQLALLHQRIEDAAAAGCRLLFVETGERVAGRPDPSYRNILRAGFEEAYLRPNWTPTQEASSRAG
jgi:GNAT superfamily N-acetyltransferase